MSEPRPPATPPPVPKDGATGEWSDLTARDTPKAADVQTITVSGQTQTVVFEIPNPFGRYSIARLLGRGGMGAVFLAHDTHLDRPVALKIPTISGTPTAAQKERFFREARAVSALRHPNICPVHDVGEEQGVLYLTTSYIDGHPLATALERGPMSPEKAVELVRKVAQAMQAAHSHGTVHRDLKPANIMIDRNGEPVIMDFGLARRTSWADDSREPGTSQPIAQGLTQFGSVLGTPAYMPPEQARGDVEAIGPQSDVYSLGVILFELLTGRRPFVADDTAELIQKIVNDSPPKLSEFYPWIDPKVEAACSKALAKSPSERFASMAELDRVLKQAIEPELIAPPPLPPRRPKPEPPKRKRWITPMTCLLVTLSILTVCVAGPTVAIYFFFIAVSDKIKELQQVSERASVEWDVINSGRWQQPSPDATADELFPRSLPNGFNRVAVDTNVADEELGLTIPGQRAIYRNVSGEEREVRVYRSTEAQSKAIQDTAMNFVRFVQAGNAGSGNRKKVMYTANNSGQRTVTFGFSDSVSQNQEYGKLWYSRDWLFYFKTSTPLVIESFPSGFLMQLKPTALPAPPKKEAKKEKNKP
jgi:serine/threonine protein kinase